MAIKWEEPPMHNARRSSKWPAIFDELRTRPREWALVQEDTTPSTVGNIKRGTYAGSNPGEFEARSVSAGDGKKSNVYARYVG